MKNRFYIMLILVVFLGACAPYQSAPQYQRVVGQMGNAAIDSESYRQPGLIEAIVSIPQKILFGERQSYTEAAIATPNGVVGVQSSTNGYSGNYMYVPGSNYAIRLPGGSYAPGYNAWVGSNSWGFRSWR